MWALRRIFHTGTPRRCFSTLDKPFLEPSQHKRPKYTKVQGWTRQGDPNVNKLRDVFSPIGKSGRSQGSVVVLEGKRLIADALRLGLVPSHVMFSRISLLNDVSLDGSNDTQFYHTSYRLIEQWSSLTTPTGIMASFHKDDIISLASSSNASNLRSLTLILDNIRNPDNMGAILRSAVAAGVSQIIATVGCVDVWNDKCLRGATGAHFLMPIHRRVPWGLIHRFVPQSAHVALADLFVEGEYSQDQGVGGKYAQGNKVSDDFSLLETRQRVENLLAESASNYRESDPESPGEYIDASFSEESILSAYSRLAIQSTEYWNFSRESNETVILVGGETEGVSPQARKFVLDRNGTQYFIPLLNGIDSLNVSVATSILLFEVQKSYREELFNNK